MIYHHKHDTLAVYQADPRPDGSYLLTYVSGPRGPWRMTVSAESLAEMWRPA